MIGRADQPFFLHLLHQPRGLVVADRELALDVGGGAFAIPDHDLHRLIVKRILLAGIAAKAEHQIKLAFLLAVGAFHHAANIFGRAEGFEMVHHLLDLLIADERPVHTGDARAARHVEHVAHAQKLLGALFAQNGAAIDLARDLEGDPRGEIGLDGAGDHIHARALGGHDEVDAGGARHLRQALDAGLDLLARNHHQIGHLIHDHHDIGQGFGGEFLGFEDGFAGFVVKARLNGAREHLALRKRLAHAPVVTLDIAHPHLRHLAVALLHLAHHPFQRHHGLLGIGDDRRKQMRDTVIDGKLQHLRIDHDEAAFLGGELVKEREDHGIDRHRFARSGGAGDQQVRHLGEIRHHRRAADILAQRQRQAHGAVAKFTAREDLAQHHHLAGFIGQFDADHAAPGDGGDPRRKRRHRARDIVGKPDHPAGLEAGGGLELIHRHHRAGANAHDLALDAVIIKHAFKHARVFFQSLLGKLHARRGGGVGEKRQRGLFVIILAFFEEKARLRLLKRLARRLHGFCRRMLNDRLVHSRFRARRRGGAQGRFMRRRHMLGGGCQRWRISEDHRLGAIGARKFRLRPGGFGQDLGLAHTGPDRIGDLGLDPILATGNPGRIRARLLLDKLRLRHGLALQDRGQAIKKPLALGSLGRRIFKGRSADFGSGRLCGFAMARRRDDARHFPALHHRRVRKPRIFAAIALRQGRFPPPCLARSPSRTRIGNAAGEQDATIGDQPRGSLQKAPHAFISQQNAEQQKTGKALDFILGEAQRVKPRGKGQHREEEGDRLDPEGRCDRQHIQERAQYRIAEHPAKAEIVAPAGARHEARRIDGEKRREDRHEDHPPERPLFAPVQQEAQTPGHKRNPDAPASPAGDHVNGRGDRRPDAPEPVVHRLVRCREPARIIGRVGMEHRHHRNAKHKHQQAQKLLAPPLEGSLQPGVKQLFALFDLIGCHVYRPQS